MIDPKSHEALRPPRLSDAELRHDSIPTDTTPAFAAPPPKKKPAKKKGGK